MSFSVDMSNMMPNRGNINLADSPAKYVHIIWYHPLFGLSYPVLKGNCFSTNTFVMIITNNIKHSPMIVINNSAFIFNENFFYFLLTVLFAKL